VFTFTFFALYCFSLRFSLSFSASYIQESLHAHVQKRLNAERQAVPVSEAASTTKEAVCASGNCYVVSEIIRQFLVFSF
jgi:hypothetical protein